MHWIDLILQFGPHPQREEGGPRRWMLRADLLGEREEVVFEEPFPFRDWRSVERARERGELPRSERFTGGRGSVESAARDLGAALFAAVFVPPVNRLWGRAEEIRRREGEGVRLVVDLSDPAARELGQHRWELLADSKSKRFLARDKNTAIVRRLRSSSSGEVDASTFRLVVVHGPEPEPSDGEESSTDSVGNAWPSIEREARELLALSSTAWEIETLTVSRRSELVRRLREAGKRPVHGLHFIGHGGYDATWDLGSMSLDPRGDSVEDSDLAQLLHRVEGLRFVFLNLCSGARSAEIGGLAAQLSAVGIPAVLAAGRAIRSEAATAFALELYRELAEGRRLVEALSEARLAVGGEAGHPLEWSAYQLFEGSESVPLVAVAAENVAGKGEAGVPNSEEDAEDLGPEGEPVVLGWASRSDVENPSSEGGSATSRRRPSPAKALLETAGVALTLLLVATYLLSYVGSWPPKPGYAGDVPLLSLWPSESARDFPAAHSSEERQTPSSASPSAPGNDRELLTLSLARSEELLGSRWTLTRTELGGQQILGLSLLLPDGQALERPIYGPGPLDLGEESPWRVYVERVDPAQGEAAIIVSTP